MRRYPAREDRKFCLAMSSDESATIRRTCWFHGRGAGCRNGDACPHSHDADHIAELRRRKPQRRPDPRITAPEQEGAIVIHRRAQSRPDPRITALMEAARHQPCWLYVEGCCERGARCPYSHDATLIKAWLQRWYETQRMEARREAAQRVLRAYAQLREQQRPELCRYFLDGDCANGNACHYRHSL